MAEVIDTAYVDIVPRLNNFSGQLRRELNRAFKPVEADVKKVGHQIGGQFSESFRSAADNGLRTRLAADIGRSLGTTQTVARRQGHDAGEAYGRAFSRAADDRVRSTRLRVPAPNLPSAPSTSRSSGGGGGGGGGGSDAITRRMASGLARATIGLAAFSSAAGIAGGAVAALASGFASLTGAIGPAAGALAVIPSAAIAAAQAGGTVMAAFSGIGDAVKAMGKADTASAAASQAAGAAREAAAERVRTATNALAEARQQADETAMRGAEQVRAATERVDDAQRAGAERVAAAERTLADAQRDARQALADLNRERVDAKERIEDLNLSLKGAALSEQEAVLAIARAQQRLSESKKKGGLDYREDVLNLQQAKLRLEEVRERNADLRREAAAASKAGVEGDEQVIAAKGRLSEANRKAGDAERGLRDARMEAARDVSRAQREVAQATRDASAANAAASRAVAEAQHDLSRAQRQATAATTKTTAAQSAQAEALSKLSPAGRRFAKFLSGTMVPALLRLRNTAQEATLPGVQAGMSKLLTLQPLISRALSQTGRVIGDLAVQGANMVTSGPWRRDFATVASGNAKLIGTFGQAALKLAPALRDIVVAAQPLAQRFADFTLKASEAIRKFVAAKRESGALKDFFKKAGDTAAQLGRIIGNLSVGLFNTFRIGSKEGQGLLDKIEGITRKFKAWTQSLSGQNAIAKYFQDGSAVLQAFGRLGHDAAQMFGDSFSADAFVPLIDQVRTQLLPAFDELFTSVSSGDALSDLISAASGFVVTLSSAGGAFDAFAETLRAISDGVRFIVENVPGASTALTGLGIAAGVAFGVSVVSKITGVSAAIRAVSKSTWAHTAATAASKTMIGTWLGVKKLEATAWATSRLKAIGAAIATGAASVATWAAAAATWALNAAMAVLTSPITLVVVAIAALVAGLIYAYKHSDTFKRIVDAALRAVGAVAMWLWEHAIKPAFNGILAVFKAVWWVAQHVLWPIIVTAFAGIKLAVGLAFKGIQWYWNNVVRPVFHAVASVAKWLWHNVIAPAFEGIKKAVGAAFSGIKWVWEHILKPTFGFLQRTVGKIAGWFDKAKDGIGKAWGKVKDLAKAPIRFVIQTVLNDGLIKAFNWISDKVGGKQITPIPLPKGFQTGGIYPGYTPGRDIGVAAVSGGEAIMRPEWTRAVGAQRVHRWNRAARAGGAAAVAREMAGGYALGGIIDRIPGARTAAHAVGAVAGKVKDVALGGTRAAFKAATDPLVKLADHLRGNAFGDMVAAVPHKIQDTVLGWLGQKDASAMAAGGGGGPVNPGLAGALAWARSQIGKPYVWGGVGPGGYDCSGWISAIVNAIRGAPLFHRLFSTGSLPAAGFVPGRNSAFKIGWFTGNPGHVAGTLNGVNVESRGGQGVVVGPGARGWNAGLFNRWAGLAGYKLGGIAGDPPFDILDPRGKAYGRLRQLTFDRGGQLPPGLTLAYNGTGAPERVIGPQGGRDVHLHFHGPVGSRRELEDWLVETFSKLQREGRA